MEGLVLSATAFMSFASILWLVVVKLAAGNEEYDDEAEHEQASSLSSTSSHPNLSTSSTSEKKRMNRRRRRNGKKKDLEAQEASCSSMIETESETSLSKNQKKRSSLASKFYLSLGWTDDQIYFHLFNYIVDQDTLRSLGFPLESQLSPGKAWVFQDPDFRGGTQNFVFDDEPTSKLDANAREFVPNKIEELASTLSAEAKEFIPAKSTCLEDEIYQGRNCARCNKLYYVFKNTGECVQQEDCVYHWGKARNTSKYSCCGRRSKTGCEKAPSHVWRGFLYEISGQHKDLDSFAKTRIPRNRAQPTDGNYGVYGIDGEMLFTTSGLQLCKITVVGIDGRLVYETIVMPEDPIIDYNTRFSGISAKDLKRGPVKSLKDVQNDLLGFINANTILIGHGLENDLRALKLVHMTVIDTSLVFPHYYGMPFRRSLKSIVQSYLKCEIQGEKCGHDSYEDARSCVELMLWKVQQDFGSQQSASTQSSKYS